MAKAKWGFPVPASGEVHWGMKGKVGNMKSFRRRRSYGGPKRNSSWVSYVDDGWQRLSTSMAACAPMMLGQMSAYDSLGGGTQGGSSNYLAIRQKVTIARFQGAIWVTADNDDDLTAQAPMNHMMLNYVWRKQQLDADAAGGTSILTATNQDPSPSTIGDLGRLLRFRDINKWGTVQVPCFVGEYSETTGAYSGVTTGASNLNPVVSMDLNYQKKTLPGQYMARIPLPRGPIALKEGEGIACIVSAWSARQFEGSFSTNGRGLLYYRQYRALHVSG